MSFCSCRVGTNHYRERSSRKLTGCCARPKRRRIMIQLSPPGINHMDASRFPFAMPNSRGLLAITETLERVILPLKGVECDFSVLSGIAEVSMTQIFRQENDQPMDCEYLFPLPADASVYFCEADINGRTIRAQVRERQEARQLAAEKKAAGFRTALVESERDNLFTLSLGNVQPGDLVVISLKYVQTLRSLAESR